jgi:SPW repeat
MSAVVRLRLPGMINLVLAIWLALGSFMVGFGNVPSKTSDVILGFFVAFLSMHRSIPSDQSRFMYLFTAVLGLGAIAAPFVFSYSDVTSATLNNIIVGAAIFLVSVWGYTTMRIPDVYHL